MLVLAKLAPSFLLGVLFLLKGRRLYFFALFAFFGQPINKTGGVRRELDVGYIARKKTEGAICPVLLCWYAVFSGVCKTMSQNEKKK